MDFGGLQLLLDAATQLDESHSIENATVNTVSIPSVGCYEEVGMSASTEGLPPHVWHSVQKDASRVESPASKGDIQRDCFNLSRNDTAPVSFSMFERSLPERFFSTPIRAPNYRSVQSRTRLNNQLDISTASKLTADECPLDLSLGSQLPAHMSSLSGRAIDLALPRKSEHNLTILPLDLRIENSFNSVKSSESGHFVHDILPMKREASLTIEDSPSTKREALVTAEDFPTMKKRELMHDKQSSGKSMEIASTVEGVDRCPHDVDPITKPRREPLNENCETANPNDSFICEYFKMYQSINNSNNALNNDYDDSERVPLVELKLASVQQENVMQIPENDPDDMEGDPTLLNELSIYEYFEEYQNLNDTDSNDSDEDYVAPSNRTKNGPGLTVDDKQVQDENLRAGCSKSNNVPSVIDITGAHALELEMCELQQKKKQHSTTK
ncbi:uncharacterized protein LOC134205590 [Armigeres subalbatus]|uniref:uncharacterized protein LOC134205590 n=1 Tax=Armigeres subalbatus TaxID=124917 RepID=UPI002ED1BCFE